MSTEQERILQAVLAGDQASQSLGLALTHTELGRVCLEMAVRPDMANGGGICHGGFIFAAADTACAFACMTGGEFAVVQSAHITFTSPAHVGETLVADASEVAPGRRGGTFDTTVTGDGGRLVALVRSTCRTTGRPVVVAGPTSADQGRA